MRSYPLLGLFLVTRHAVSKTASSTAILRPTATGISLLFLSLMHSSAAIEVRVTDVTGWPQRWKVILPPPALASQRRKRDGGTGLVPAASEAQMGEDEKGRGHCSPGTCSVSGHLRGILYHRSPGPTPKQFWFCGSDWGPGDSDLTRRQIQLWEILVKARGQDQNCVLTLDPG